MSEYKVGDKVLICCDDYDLAPRGSVQYVSSVGGRGVHTCDDNCYFDNSEFTLYISPSIAPDDFYIRILEEMLSPEDLATAKRIREML